MATPATQPSTPNAVPGALLPDMFGAGFAHSTGINDMIANIANAWLALGNTAAGATLLDELRLHDGVSEGLSVPLAALVSEPLTVNGNMDHFQRVLGSGTATSTTTFNRITSFAADRMFVRPVGASVTQARSTTVPDARSRYSLAVTGAASVTTVDVGQRIRASVIATRGLQSLVFSCYVRNESGGAYIPTLRIGTPASADDFTTVTNRLDQSLQSCADSAWTRVYHVFDPSAYTNIANGMEVVLRIPSGSSVAADINRIAQFDLRPGTHLRGYVPPDPDLELDRCKVYCRTFGGGNVFEIVAWGFVTTTTRLFCGFPVSPAMRAVPSLDVSASADWGIQIAGGGVTASNGVQIDSLSSPQIVGIIADVASGLTAGTGGRLLANNTANARLHLTSELL